MILSNYHTHTVLCDGSNTMGEFAEAAIAAGFHSLGFSGHGRVPFESVAYGMAPEAARLYREGLVALKAEYAGRLDIFCGLENDSAYMHPADGYDYTIGSVHCIKHGGEYYSVDSSVDSVERAVAEAFNGDGEAFAEAYFGTVAEFASIRRADILGHIDLVRRFNTGGKRLFDESDPRYCSAAKAAMENAVRSGYIIEVNTAPLAKGFSDEPYPAVFLLKYASELGARVMVNSDAHTVKNLNCAFGMAEALLRGIGFKERWELTPDGFVPTAV